jgi:hypothetical protein
MHFWGSVFTWVYGGTPYEQRTDKLQQMRWHKWEWVCGLELAFMLFDYYEYTLDPGLFTRSVFDGVGGRNVDTSVAVAAVSA